MSDRTLIAAQHHVAREHNRIVMLRDRRGIDQRAAAKTGDILAALNAQLDVARLEGELAGLATATAQLRILVRRHRESS